jgi:glycine C-acetyltransferase
MKALDVLTPEYIKKVTDNATYFRNELKRVGLEYMGTDHPIVPVLIPESKRSKTIQEISTELYTNGLLVPGLSYPVVPQGTDRLRFQISAAHTKQELDRALEILISTLL